MNTSISSKREFVAPQVEWNVSSTAVAGLIGGFLVMVLGIALNVTAIAGIGFVALVTSFIYLHSMFWAKIIDSKGPGNRSLDSLKRWY